MVVSWSEPTRSATRARFGYLRGRFFGRGDAHGLGATDLDLGECFATGRDVGRELLELLDRCCALARRANRRQATGRELELLERGDVVVHARDEALAVLRDVRAVAALVLESRARRLILRLDLGVGRARDPLVEILHPLGELLLAAARDLHVGAL